ncbi:protein LAZ1 homolog 1 [Tanacetum coccineum]
MENIMRCALQQQRNAFSSGTINIITKERRMTSYLLNYPVERGRSESSNGLPEFILVVHRVRTKKGWIGPRSVYKASALGDTIRTVEGFESFGHKVILKVVLRGERSVVMWPYDRSHSRLLMVRLYHDMHPVCLLLSSARISDLPCSCAGAVEERQASSRMMDSLVCNVGSIHYFLLFSCNANSIEFVKQTGVAAVVHLYVFPAVPYKCGERCVCDISVMTDYAALGAPPDAEEVRDLVRLMSSLEVVEMVGNDGWKFLGGGLAWLVWFWLVLDGEILFGITTYL